jgi:hypothetical protein
MGGSPPSKEWCGKMVPVAILGMIFYALPRMAFATWKDRKAKKG